MHGGHSHAIRWCGGEYLLRAEALVLAVGGMDALPAAVPTYLRQGGIAYIRPGWVRRKVRGLCLELSPRVMAITGGPLRQLPQAATDHYLSRLVPGGADVVPRVAILLLTPSPHSARHTRPTGSTRARTQRREAWGSHP